MPEGENAKIENLCPSARKIYDFPNASYLKNFSSKERKLRTLKFFI
jgi:hypothetical protein